MAVVVAQLVTSVPGVGQWTSSPLEAFADGRGVGLLVLGLGLALLTTVSVRVMGGMASPHIRGFAAVFGLAILAYTLSQQTVVRAAGFGYAFWALGLGLAIANTVGTPVWVKPALRSELYIKTGLVLLGAEILFGNHPEPGRSGSVRGLGGDPHRPHLHVSVRYPCAAYPKSSTRHRDRRRHLGVWRLGGDCRRGRRAG